MKYSNLFVALACILPSLVNAQSITKARKAQAIVIIDQPTKVLENLNYSLPPGKPVVEDPESSPSSPPLETDDPGTPGTGGIEVNMITDCDSAKDSRSCEAGIDAAFGVGEKMQIRVSKYVVSERNTGEPTFHGVGQSSAGVKYRFYDKNGLALAVFPSYQFNDATRRTNTDGTAADSEGSAIYLPLILSKQFGKWTVVTNAGYTANLDHPDSNSVFTSVGVGHAVGRTSRVMGEVTADTSKAGTRSDVRIGWVKVIFPNEKSRYSTALFVSAGKSIKSDDSRSHTTLRIGLSVALKPRQ